MNTDNMGLGDSVKVEVVRSTPIERADVPGSDGPREDRVLALALASVLRMCVAKTLREQYGTGTYQLVMDFKLDETLTLDPTLLMIQRLNNNKERKA